MYAFHSTAAPARSPAGSSTDPSPRTVSAEPSAPTTVMASAALGPFGQRASAKTSQPSSLGRSDTKVRSASGAGTAAPLEAETSVSGRRNATSTGPAAPAGIASGETVTICACPRCSMRSASVSPRGADCPSSDRAGAASATERAGRGMRTRSDSAGETSAASGASFASSHTLSSHEMRTTSSELVGFAITSTTASRVSSSIQRMSGERTRNHETMPSTSASPSRDASIASERIVASSTGSAIHAAIGAGAPSSLQVATSASANSAAVPSLAFATRASAASHIAVVARAAMQSGDAGSSGAGAGHPRSAQPSVKRKRSNGASGSGRPSRASGAPSGTIALTRAARRARRSSGAGASQRGSMRPFGSEIVVAPRASVGSSIAR